MYVPAILSRALAQTSVLWEPKYNVAGVSLEEGEHQSTSLGGYPEDKTPAITGLERMCANAHSCETREPGC
jgi:hypothetical protein